MKYTALFLLLCSLLLACSESGGTNDETTIRTSAIVYEPDGKTPADSVTVKIFDAASVDGKYASMQITSSDGRFYLDGLSAGRYVIWFQKDSMVTCQNPVVIALNDTALHNDTLAYPSTVTGIIGVQPQDDPRSVTIQVVGLDKYFNNTGSDGRFTMKNMAAGTYTLLLRSTEPHYTPTTVEVTITPSATVALKDTLRLTYTGIPVISGLQVAYDTVGGRVRISWNRTDYRGFENYCIFRDIYDSANYSTSPISATIDTVYNDTIFNKRLSSGAFSRIDSCSYHFRYRVAVRNNVSVIGPIYKYADIWAVSPLKIRPAFVFSSKHVAKNLKFSTMYDSVKTGGVILAGEASIGDTVLLYSNVKGSSRGLVRLEWVDILGTVIRSVDSSLSVKIFTDSLFRKWETTGIHSIICVATDNAGTKWYDTIRIRVVEDKPLVKLKINDTLAVSIESSGKVFRYGCGDTVPLHLATRDRFGSIVTTQWRLGASVADHERGPVFDTVAIVPDSAGSQFRVVAGAMDDDSNFVSDTLFIEPRLFAPSTLNADFRERTYQAGVVFNDKIWITGGVGIVQQTPKTNFTCLNDVWASDNGRQWTQKTTNTPARSGHALIVFNNKIWLIGGYANSWGKYLNDVWCSDDGLSWKCVIDSAAFSPRIYHSCLVFNGKMWIIGGQERKTLLNDVWSSSDGVTWVNTKDAAPFSQRCSHSGVVFDDKMWVIGGRDTGYNALNDVWCSSDGAEWKLVNDDAAFSPRQGHCALVYNKKIWLVGGYGFNASDMSLDIWNSENGISWVQVDTMDKFTPRAFHSGLVFHNRMWVIAGMTGFSSLANDVWRSGEF
jgi:Kelch motif